MSQNPDLKKWRAPLQKINVECKYCFSSDLTKKGKTAKGKNRFFCKNCKKSFTQDYALSFKDCVYIGIDFINFLSNDFLNGYLSQQYIGLDDNNTNTRNVNLFGFEFSVHYAKTPHGKTLYFSYDSEIVFSCEKLSQDHKRFIKLPVEQVIFRWSIYGAFFNLVRLGIIQYTYLNYFQCLNPKLTRLDFCFDFIDYDVTTIAQYLMTKRKRKVIFKSKDDEVETLYFGDKRVSRNSKYIIRIYDKIKDTLAKKKERFYSDYFKYKCVTRFEIEIRSSSINDFNFQYMNLFNYDMICRFVKSILTTRFTNFDFDFDQDKFLSRIDPELNPAGVEYFAKRLKNLWLRVRDFGYSDSEILKIIQ